MATNYCSDDHDLKGTRVERTTHVDRYIVRVRKCGACGRAITTIERDREMMELETRNEREKLESVERDYKWAIEAVKDLSIAIKARQVADERIVEIAREKARCGT